jgi:hypothetical protein
MHRISGLPDIRPYDVAFINNLVSGQIPGLMAGYPVGYQILQIVGYPLRYPTNIITVTGTLTMIIHYIFIGALLYGRVHNIHKSGLLKFYYYYLARYRYLVSGHTGYPVSHCIVNGCTIFFVVVSKSTGCVRAPC